MSHSHHQEPSRLMMRLIIALAMVVGAVTAKNCGGNEDPSECGSASGITVEMCASSVSSIQATAAATCPGLCGTCAKMAGPQLKAKDGSLVASIPEGSHFSVTVQGSDPVNIDEIPAIVAASAAATKAVIDDKIQPQLTQLEEDFETELVELKDSMNPKLNALAAAAQMDSLQSQCHEAPECTSDGECASAKKDNGANCNDYNADTSDDACKEGTCVGTNLCEGVNCGTAIVCRQDSICFRGKCLAGSPVKSGTSCTVKNEDDTTADSTCNANGECSPATPVITSVSPKTILLPGAIPVTVTGKNFKMGSQLEFNGVGMPTSWQNSKILVAQHPLEADISTSKSHSIGIVTPGLGRTVYKDQLTIREWKGPWGEAPWGDGRDGGLSCGNLENYNDKSKAYRVKGVVKRSDTKFKLGVAPNGMIKVGDKILLIVMQDFRGPADNTAGLHEFFKVVKIEDNYITVEQGVSLFNGLTFTPGNWGQMRVIVQKVPQYTSVSLSGCTLKPKTYDVQDKPGAVNSGLVVFVAKGDVKFQNGAKIDASMAGHRGGLVPNLNRCVGGCKIRKAGYAPADAVNEQADVKGTMDGGVSVKGGDGGSVCSAVAAFAGKGGKGGCTTDYGCSSYTGGGGNHGGGGGARDYSQAGAGGAGAACPGRYPELAQKKLANAGVLTPLTFSRIVLGGGASAGGGGGKSSHSSASGGKGLGNGGYRTASNHGGGDGGNGAPGGGSVYIFAKDGVSGGGTIIVNGGNGGGGGGGELGGHKSSGGGGGGGGHGGSGGTIVTVVGKGKIGGTIAGVKHINIGGRGGGGGGGAGVPSQHNPTASGSGGGGARGQGGGAYGGGGGGGSPSSGGPYMGGRGMGWNHDTNSGTIAGTDAGGGGGRGRFPGGGGGCSYPGGGGGSNSGYGRSSSYNWCGNQNWGKSGNDHDGGEGGRGSQSCGRDSNFGAGGAGGGRGAVGAAGESYWISV